MAVIALLLGVAFADPYEDCQAGDGGACWGLVHTVDRYAKKGFVTRACELGVMEACSHPDGDARVMDWVLCDSGDEEACWKALVRDPSEDNLTRACASGWKEACPDGPLRGLGPVVQGMVALPEIPLAPVRGGILVVSEAAPKRLGIWTPASEIVWGIEVSPRNDPIAATSWGPQWRLNDLRPARSSVFVSAQGVSGVSALEAPPRAPQAFEVQQGKLTRRGAKGEVLWSVDTWPSKVLAANDRLVVLVYPHALFFRSASDGRLLQRLLLDCDEGWWTEHDGLLCTQTGGPGVLLHLDAGAAEVPEVRVDRVVGPPLWTSRAEVVRAPARRILDRTGGELPFGPRSLHPCFRDEALDVDGVCQTDLVPVTVAGQGLAVLMKDSTEVLHAVLERPVPLQAGTWEAWLVSEDRVERQTVRLDDQPVTLRLGGGEQVPALRVVDAQGVPLPLRAVGVRRGKLNLGTGTADFAGFVRLPMLEVPGSGPAGFGRIDGELQEVRRSAWSKAASDTPAGLKMNADVGGLRKGELVLSVCGHDVEHKRWEEAAAATVRPSQQPCQVVVWRQLERVSVPLPAELSTPR